MTNLHTAFAVQMSPSWHDGGLFMGMHWGWWTFWILTLAVLAWGLVRVASDRSSTRREERRRGDAEEDLRARYARGELDEDEYRRMLEVLRETRGHGP